MLPIRVRLPWCSMPEEASTNKEWGSRKTLPHEHGLNVVKYNITKYEINRTWSLSFSYNTTSCWATYEPVHLHLDHLQFISNGSASILTARTKAKSLVWKFFQEGEKEREMICQLCPSQTIVKKKNKNNGITSNMLRHLKNFHSERFYEEQSKQAVMKMQNHFIR